MYLSIYVAPFKKLTKVLNIAVYQIYDGVFQDERKTMCYISGCKVFILEVLHDFSPAPVM